MNYISLKFVKLICIVLISFTANCVFGQEQITDDSEDVDPEHFIEKSLEVTDFSVRIPTIDSLKVLAEQNSPLLKYYEMDVEYAAANVSLARTKWMDYIYGDAVYNYGMFNYLSDETSSGDLTLVDQSLINTETSRYTVGVSMKIPISAFFNRKKNIRAEKALEERAKYRRAATVREIERELILNYNDLLKAHRLMFIAGTIVDTYKIQSLRAKTDYENGLISLSEYTRLQQQMNQSFKEFERERANFLLAFMYLENTIGTKLEIK
ncbi:Outer membrane efflux protein [Pustulibacterium marinum]|uniref:Outer membrane efflux protein n=1 Tax=Pustulibacterium marinum TaxID=1224947 RepID=A0A1I7GDP8_9FLAO|nr:TolC family protein [Pustulibacterium marinum]SFU46589.1 Outer membrane efflux protein [Pustulibacterium marinum]